MIQTYIPTSLALGTTIEQNLAARFAYFSQAPQTRFYLEPEMIYFTTNIAYPNLHFNVVFQTRFSTVESTYAGIGHILKQAQARHVPMFWITGPSAQPANLGYYLELHGLSHIIRGQGMTIDLDHLNRNLSTPAGLTIERVKSLEQLQQFVTVLATNFEMPESIIPAWFELEASLGFKQRLPYQRYLGYWHGEPVATSTLFAGAGVAGLYYVATLPQARGQGIGAAISLAAMQDAQRLGYQTGALIAMPKAENIYRRLGFQPTTEFNFYLWPGEKNY